jgi:methyl-accepting chemotaxis protein
VEEAAAASQSMSQQADHLSHLVDAFKLSAAQMEGQPAQEDGEHHHRYHAPRASLGLR